MSYFGICQTINNKYEFVVSVGELNSVGLKTTEGLCLVSGRSTSIFTTISQFPMINAEKLLRVFKSSARVRPSDLGRDSGMERR